MGGYIYLVLLSLALSLNGANGLDITLVDGTVGTYMGKYPDRINDGPGSIHTTDGLIVEGEFKNGALHGDVHYFYQNGAVIVKTFDRGTLVSERTAFSAPPNDTPQLSRQRYHKWRLQPRWKRVIQRL